MAGLCVVGASARAGVVDTNVEEAMQRAGERRVDVLVVGAAQLLPDRDAFGAFTRANADADRRDLRSQVVAHLQRLARDEQAEIRRAIERDVEWRALWIVNAMVASLAPEEIGALAGHESVRIIHLAGELPTGRAGGASQVVLRPAEDRAFAIADRRIAWNVAQLGVPLVWDEMGYTGEGVVVAVYDEGVNLRHPDLRARIWRNQNEIPRNGEDDDGNGYVDDVHGFDFGAWGPDVSATVNARGREHGTMTSGIVAGDGSGGIITGVAPRSKIMPLVTGPGLYQAALAHEYAILNGADIMSMSFSRPGLGQGRGFWRLMSEHSVCAGLVLVSGAGNFKQTARVPEQQRIPEGIPCVISVGGVDRDRRPSSFSSMGQVTWADVPFYEDHPMPRGLTKPDVAAFCGPGYAVLASGSAGYVDPNAHIKGNSFSGPQGAGVCALMLEASPKLGAWRLREILEATAVDLGEPGKGNTTGAGLIDAPSAVRAAIEAR